MRWQSTLVASAILLALAGCAAKKRLTAEEHFRQASRDLQDGAYRLAVMGYRELLDQYPFSEHSEEAELKIGHAYYLDGSCPEAIAAFGDFQRRHPTSPYLAFASYLIGQCYERQMRPPDRDQSASRNAHAYYVAVRQQYPDSPFADLAREDLSRCRESLAKHEALVAGFYARHGNDKAAEYRLLDLVNRFNDTDTAAEALYRLGQMYSRQGASEQAVLAFAAVEKYHRANGLAKKARRVLAKLAETHEIPEGDPLIALRAQTGRSRALALAEVVDVPGLETKRRPAPGPALGGAPDLGPFGGRY